MVENKGILKDKDFQISDSEALQLSQRALNQLKTDLKSSDSNVKAYAQRIIKLAAEAATPLQQQEGLDTSQPVKDADTYGR